MMTRAFGAQSEFFGCSLLLRSTVWLSQATDGAPMHSWHSSLPARALLRPSPRRLLSSSAPSCTDKPVMNRYSRMVTKPKSQGASQAMLYDTDGVETEADFDKAMVGVASVW